MKEKKLLLDLNKLRQDKYRALFLFLSISSTLAIATFAIYFAVTIILNK
jgi:hypothetical protein